MVTGMLLSRLATQYYQLFLSQGVWVGLGMGILYMSGLSVPSSYFKAKGSVAVAIVATDIYEHSPWIGSLDRG